MPSGRLLLAFLATAAVIVAVPGPSLLFTIGRAITVGRRAALLTVVGNAAGLLVQSVLVAVGLGAVLAGSATAYTVVKLAGAAYLVYLGVTAIRHRGDLAATLLEQVADTEGEPGAVARGPGAGSAAAVASAAAPASDRSASAGSASDRLGSAGSASDRSASAGSASDRSASAGSARSGDLRSLGQGLTVGLTNPKTLVFLSSLLPQFVDPAGSPQPQILALGAVFAVMAMVGDAVWALAAGRARDWFARSPARLGRFGAGGGLLMIGLGVTVALAGRPTG